MISSKTQRIVPKLIFSILWVISNSVWASNSDNIYFVTNTSESIQPWTKDWEINKFDPQTLEIFPVARITTPRNKFILRFSPEQDKIAFLESEGQYIRSGLRTGYINPKPKVPVPRVIEPIPESDTLSNRDRAIIKVVSTANAKNLVQLRFEVDSEQEVVDFYWINADSIVIHLKHSQNSRSHNYFMLEGYQQVESKSTIILLSVSSGITKLLTESGYNANHPPLQLKHYSKLNTIYLSDIDSLLTLDLISGKISKIYPLNTYRKKISATASISWSGSDPFSPRYMYSPFIRDENEAGIVNINSGAEVLFDGYPELPNYMSIKILGWAISEDKVFYQLVMEMNNNLSEKIAQNADLDKIYSMDLHTGDIRVIYTMNYNDIVAGRNIGYISEHYIIIPEKDADQSEVQWYLVDLLSGVKQSLGHILNYRTVRWISTREW